MIHSMMCLSSHLLREISGLYFGVIVQDFPLLFFLSVNNNNLLPVVVEYMFCYTKALLETSRRSLLGMP